MAVFLLILLVCLILGVIVAFACLGKRGRRILGLIGLGLVLLGVLPLIGVRSVARHNVHQTSYSSTEYYEGGSSTLHERSFSVKMNTPEILAPSALEPQLAPQPATPEPLTAVEPSSITWTPSAEGDFLYDVYPTAESAATALTRMALRSCDEFTVPNATPIRVDIVAGSSVSEPVRATVADVIRQKNPAAQITWQDNQAETASRPTSETQVVRIELRQTQILPADSMSMTAKRHIEVALAGEDGERKSYGAAHVEKRWVEDLPEFQRQKAEHGRTVLAAYSNGLWATAEDAHRQAEAVAQQQIESRLASFLSSMPVSVEGPQLAWQPGDVAHVVVGFLKTGRPLVSPDGELATTPLIIDEFVQRAERPYGQLYRAALLVDLSQAQLDVLARNAMERGSARHANLKTKVFSTAALLLAVTLVYALLQAATRGYYVWSVRLVAVAILAGGVFVVLAMA